LFRPATAGFAMWPRFRSRARLMVDTMNTMIQKNWQELIKPKKLE
jgi:hypothetical protein